MQLVFMINHVWIGRSVSTEARG